MTNKEVLQVIQAEALHHAQIAEALNDTYQQVTGEDAVPQNPDGKLRRLPEAAANMGLGAVYRTGNGNNR